MKLRDYLKEGLFYKGQNVTIIESGEDGCISKIGANTQMVQFKDGTEKPYSSKEIKDRK